MTTLSKVHNIDARELDKVLNKAIVDATITSPPYFDLKDYGHKAQIGFGQEYEAYLSDLELVFKKVYRATKKNGSLWVIIDTFRKGNAVVPLPFDFSNRLKNVGWQLQDIIIWHKDKTLPWAKKGQTRSILEYVLFFTKGTTFKYYTDKERQFDPGQLKQWWIKYPERYNPKGKALDGIWKYPIPIQGSWGSGYIRHFCPLPPELIARIIRLSTKRGDVVFDPFAGSGAVLAQAAYMNRRYIGVELNRKYISMFNRHLEATLKIKRQEYLGQNKTKRAQNVFENLILDLRVLKYARVLYKLLDSKCRDNIQSILVEKKSIRGSANTLAAAKYTIFLKQLGASVGKCRNDLGEIISRPPLSKFGVKPEFVFLSAKGLGKVALKRDINFYTTTATHKRAKVLGDQWREAVYILSHIKVDLSEKGFSQLGLDYSASIRN